jgi:hypothetical protein
MSILIGLKNTHAHGSFHGSEGFEGISMDGTVVTVIKEGTKNALIKFIADQRKLSKEVIVEMRELEDDLELSNISEEDYDQAYDKLSKKIMISRYDKLMILEGETV